MKLFEPIEIGSMTLRNRLVMSAVTTGYAGMGRLPNDRLISYLEARARGGVGLITLEAATVDERYLETPTSLHFADDAALDAHRRLVDAVHSHGARIQPQIVHGGPDGFAPYTHDTPNVGPSVIPSYLTGIPSRELAAEELPAIAGRYATAVARVREAGYDGIELHAAHAYMLLGSFLSPWRNRREDDYAGTRSEGRLRLLLEVLAAIRSEVGEDFPITLRLSGYERVAGGRGIDDTARIAPQLVAAGVDAFHISGGVIDRLTSMIVTGSQYGDAHNLSGAAAVKNVVTVPVIAVARIHDPALAEQILQDGRADLIAMARPLLADPELPNKVRSGRGQQVRRCISCQTCIDSMERGGMQCAVNGFTGRESELALTPATEPKRVVVVGGGPGGLETARLLALRGHRVTLYERDRRLGGAFALACAVHPENRPFLEFLVGEVKRLPIEVQLGQVVDAASLRLAAPDAVVVATGGRVVAQRIPGDEARHVWTGPELRQLLAGLPPAAVGDERAPRNRPGWRALGTLASRFLGPRGLARATRAWMPFGRRVAIVGTDLAALELAEFLAARGRLVTLIGGDERLAPEVGLKRLTEHMDALDRLGVAVNSGVSCEEITPDGVRIRPKSGEAMLVPADSVLLAGELVPDTELYDAIQGHVSEAHTVGDCTGLGLVHKATTDATRVACAL